MMNVKHNNDYLQELDRYQLSSHLYAKLAKKRKPKIKFKENDKD